jgi:hypothetical protein
MNRRYMRNKDIVCRKIEDETIFVPIKDNVGDMGCIYTVNKMGSFIWENLDGEKTLDDILSLITEEFEISAREAQEDLNEFISELKEIEAIHH